MATSINNIADQIKTNFKNQRLPMAYTDDDYLNLAILGCKRFYRDIGIEASWTSEYASTPVSTISRDLTILEYEYCVVSSEIEFIKSIRTYWNTMVSYTTNALTISNAFKPFEFLKETIREKEIELVELFHKMTTISNMSEIDNVYVTPVNYDYKV